VSENIPPRADIIQELNWEFLAALLRQLIRLNATVAVLKETLLAVAVRTSTDPQTEMKLRAGIEIDVERRVKQSEDQLSQFAEQLRDPVRWREFLESLAEKTEKPDA